MDFSHSLKKFEEILQDKHKPIFIDVRSPIEFQQDHIPGAYNFPVLDDIERSEVGTLYKKDPFSARHRGAGIISSRIPGILDSIEKMVGGFGTEKNFPEFIVYCWRGGMRSRSLYTILSLIGYKVKILDGGHRSYRRYVSNFFENLPEMESYTIYGPSGSGKTNLIDDLEVGGYPAINLEKLAAHKGSILGGDEKKQPSQKYFESLLFDRFHKIIKANQNWVIWEGESKKIGRLIIPDKVFKLIKDSKNIWVELPIDSRAERLAKEYTMEDEEFLNKLECIRKYISTQTLDRIRSFFCEGKRIDAAKVLLDTYYDLFYKRESPEKSQTRKYTAIFQKDNFGELHEEIIGHFHKISGKEN